MFQRMLVAVSVAAALGAYGKTAAADDAGPCVRQPNLLVADLGLHVVNAAYQRTLSCAFSAQIGAGLYVPWVVNRDVFGLGGGDRSPPDDVAGFVVRGRGFFHLANDPQAGPWLSPFAQAGPVRATRDDRSVRGRALAAGLSAGWAFAFGTHWRLALGAGVQYHVAQFGDSAARPGFARLGPTIDINLGYAL
ncbi:MAG: DUF3575 domain-containing protein [Polyangiaceae bacterium]|nr:DUF3575 domain-containing protein [Polyangiaceae bacterium]